MGSYTDNLGYLTQHNQYVQQLPVEAMATVGRQRQNQYEQGVQKIQNQIESIAGLDVVRDVDKQYLQGKLNQVNSNLRLVAAGDFSNYQLVNSVGGMITQIGKDSNIQNAVSSTMKYKKGIQEMELAKKEGKSSPSNEWEFNSRAASWLNSNNVKDGFSGGFNPYTNYKKNALEAIKALTKDETITDDAFTVDSRGNLVIADANVRKKFAGISPDKIQTALMATLSPADFKQMEIDGRYNYSNVDPRKFTQDINNSYSEKVDFYNQQKRILENAKSSTTSNLEKTKLNDQISSLDKVIRGISKEQQNMGSLLASGNIEAVKAQLHTNNFIDNFSKAFSYTETSQTYESSPFAQMAMQRATKEQDWKKFILQMGWDREKFALEYDQKERHTKAKTKEESGYGGLPMGIPQDQLPKYTLGKVIEDTEVKAEQIILSDDTFVRQQGKDKEWLDAQRVAWEKSPKGVDPKVANHFNSLEQDRRRVESNKTMISDISREADLKFGELRDKIPNDSPVVYTTPQGQTFTYTPDDFVNFNENVNKYITPLRGSKTGAVAFDSKKAQQELSPKEFHLLQIQSGIIPNTGAAKELFEKTQYYNQIVNIPFSDVTKAKNQFIADEINNRITVSQGVSYGIPTGNEVQKSTISTVLSQFADLATSQKDGLANSPNFNADIARKLSVDPTTNYSLTVVEGTQYQPAMYKVNVTGKDGETTEFNLTPEQKTTVFGDMFEASPVVQAFRPYQEQIRQMGGYSTALSPGTSNHNNAYLSKIDFPAIETYGIKGNIEQPSPGKYSIRVSAYDPVTKEWYEDISYPRNSLVREDQVIPLMLQLNDAAVFELLNEKVPTAEELKIVKEASKKPL
jgi:hypothetical protein